MTPERRRMTLLIVVASLLSPLLVMAVCVDDWSRDLTTNRAHTAPGRTVEPWELPGVTPDRVQAALQLGERWRHADEKPLPEDSPLPALYADSPATIFHLVRTTGLMGYRDDVWLVATESDGGTRLYAESRSRLGRGDLGQNPRNLQELRSLLAP